MEEKSRYAGSMPQVPTVIAHAFPGSLSIHPHLLQNYLQDIISTLMITPPLLMPNSIHGQSVGLSRLIGVQLGTSQTIPSTSDSSTDHNLARMLAMTS